MASGERRGTVTQSKEFTLSFRHEFRPARDSSLRLRILPEWESSLERVGVVARSAARWKLGQFLDVPSAEHHVLRFEGGDQACDHVRDMFPPFHLAQPMQT